MRDNDSSLPEEEDFPEICRQDSAKDDIAATSRSKQIEIIEESPKGDESDD